MRNDDGKRKIMQRAVGRVEERSDLIVIVPTCGKKTPSSSSSSGVSTKLRTEVPLSTAT